MGEKNITSLSIRTTLPRPPKNWGKGSATRIWHLPGLTVFLCLRRCKKMLSFKLLPTVSNQCRIKSKEEVNLAIHWSLSYRDFIPFYQKYSCMVRQTGCLLLEMLGLWSVNPHNSQWLWNMALSTEIRLLWLIVGLEKEDIKNLTWQDTENGWKC